MKQTSTMSSICYVEDINGQSYQVYHHHLIEAARECICKRFATGDVITSPDDVRKALQVLIGHYEREVFYALFLDSRHHILHHEALFHGTVNNASVHPREVLKAALACNASAIILAHNHPSGVSAPSDADKQITQVLKRALALVDIRVLDHLIVGRDITSMAEMGLL